MHLANEMKVLAASEEKHAKHVREHLGERGECVALECLALASDARACAKELEQAPRKVAVS